MLYNVENFKKLDLSSLATKNVVNNTQMLGDYHNLNTDKFWN